LATIPSQSVNRRRAYERFPDPKSPKMEDSTNESDSLHTIRTPIVTGVDRTSKLDMIRSIGADNVVDYTKEDFTRNGKTYNVVFDAIGRSSYSDLMRSVKGDGYLLLGNPGLSQLFRGIRGSNNGRRVLRWTGAYPVQDLVALRELIEAGKLWSVIDPRYPLEHIVEAHRYVDTGQKQGNVVISVH
jgi:NADPH:quinone reductase-like Zn-dependent oxidoreductase